MLEGLLLEKKYDSVTYVGDGRGDYCPCTKMGPMDIILARASYSGKSILFQLCFTWMHATSNTVINAVSGA